jgi:hypothetical protein
MRLYRTSSDKVTSSKPQQHAFAKDTDVVKDVSDKVSDGSGRSSYAKQAAATCYVAPAANGSLQVSSASAYFWSIARWVDVLATLTVPQAHIHLTSSDPNGILSAAGVFLVS